MKVFLLPILSLALLVGRVEGQVTLVWSGAYTEALGGQWGGDVRFGIEPSVSPMGVFAGADYFVTRCPDSCGLWGWRAGASLRPAGPGVRPFLTGAYLVRELETGEATEESRGLSLGVGLRLGLGLAIQGEITREFLGGPLEQWVVRIGIGF